MSTPRRLKDTLPVVKPAGETVLGGERSPYNVRFRTEPPTKPGDIVRLQLAEPAEPRPGYPYAFGGHCIIVVCHDLDDDGTSHGTRLKEHA